MVKTKVIQGEYIIKVKVNPTFLRETNMSKEDIIQEIKGFGRNKLMAYFSGRLFDPTGNIFQEEVTILENT